MRLSYTYFLLTCEVYGNSFVILRISHTLLPKRLQNALFLMELSEHITMLIIANIFIRKYDLTYLLMLFFILVKMLSEVGSLFLHKLTLNQGQKIH